MMRDEDARIPFAVIGILMIVLSTITAAYLLKMEASGVSTSLGDEREADLNDALACAKADIDSSLNVACIYAQSNVSEYPVINKSDTCPYPGDADAVNLARVKDITQRRLSEYLGANYAGNFVYGDCQVNASVSGDYADVRVEPVSMGLNRTWYAPLKCNDTYDTYYIVTVPVDIGVSKPGTAFNYSERYLSRTLVTSRYPLLESMTDEYEQRLNGTPLFTDLTAASFAYTWARGYCQYAFGEPMNIVDNNDLALMANAGVLLEQGYEYNSVDPVALAALAKNTYEYSKSTGDVINEDGFNDLNSYDFTNSSQSTLPAGTVSKQPKEYRFNIDDMVDAAYVDAINGSAYDNGQETRERGMLIKGSIDGAYTCRMHVAVTRTAADEVYDDTGKALISSTMFDPPSGLGVIARERWLVHSGPMQGNWTDEVTIDYIVDEYSILGAIHDDVASPYKPVTFEGFTDPNFANAVASYKSATDMDVVLFSRSNNGWSSDSRSIISQYNHWVENYTAYTLGRTSDLIKSDVGVTLDIGDYGSYQEMMDSAYAQMERQFLLNKSKYRDEQAYIQSNYYESCGAKAIDWVLIQYLFDIQCQLNYTVAQGSRDLNSTIDGQMSEYTDMNSTDLNNNARSSKNFLENEKLYIPFGLSMSLSSQPETSGNYTWKEGVKLAVDQRPNFLTAEVYVDNETGYSTRPLKLRNVCLFALPTDFVDTEQAASAVLDGIDAMAGTTEEMANATITAETTEIIHDVAQGARERIKSQIKDTLLSDITMEGDVTEGDIEQAVDEAFSKRSDGQIVGDLKNGTLQREIAKELGDRARVQAAKKLDAYVDQYAGYIETKTETMVIDAEQKAISATINACKEKIKGAFKDYMAEAASHAESQAIREALKRIPMGLPLLPPWGWWATMNVWYIDVQGQIPYLTVYDADTTPVPDPILGHKAIAYTRRQSVIKDDSGIVLGKNTPVKFHVETCAFIIVPPGEQGIGDKTGGWDEKSHGFVSDAEVNE
jgi:hypothetical protein